MKNLILKKPLFYFLNLLLLIFFFTIWSCSDSDTFIEVITDNIEDNEINDNNPMEDDQSNEEEDMDNDQMDDNQTSDENACTNPEDFTFLERNGLVFVEFENTVITEDWELATNEPNFTGDGYLVWNGAQSLGRPGNGIMTFRINIETTGTYQFIWNSAVLTGDNGTEHNDTWLRFNDADDFFGKRGESIVYPADTGKTPTPEGASADGWFKIYRSGNDL